MDSAALIFETYTKNILKYIHVYTHCANICKSGGGATLPGPAPRRPGRAGQGGPAAAWYFVYILYIFVYHMTTRHGRNG